MMLDTVTLKLGNANTHLERLRGELAELNRLRDACRALHDRQRDALYAERDLLLAMLESGGR